METVDMMIRRRIDILYLWETKWVGEKTKIINNSTFKLWYTRSKTRNEVGIIVDSSLKDKVVRVVTKEDKIIALKIVVRIRWRPQI